MSSPDDLDQLKCLASTGNTFCKSIKACNPGTIYHRGRDLGDESNFFREAHFTADGSSIVTHNEDHCLRTFILPENVLDHAEENALALAPCAQYQSASNIQSYALYPHFDLHNAALSVVLTASASVPISMRNALNYDVVHAKYPLVSARTEEHLPARCMLFTSTATHFVAGTVDQVSVFDCYRDGAEPIITHRLRTGRRKRQATGGWQMCKGVPSALNISCDGVLAIGTTAREVALFENEGFGQCAAVFSLASSSSSFAHREQGSGGTGVTDLKWSPCGRYLIVAERQSDIAQIYDIRGSSNILATLHGRHADTSQRLGFDLMPTTDGFEVWAGGTDGVTRVWKNPALSEGARLPDATFKMHDASVSSVAWNSSGSLLATSSGSRFVLPESTSESEEDMSRAPSGRSDNTLKVWSFPKTV